MKSESQLVKFRPVKLRALELVPHVARNGAEQRRQRGRHQGLAREQEGRPASSSRGAVPRDAGRGRRDLGGRAVPEPGAWRGAREVDAPLVTPAPNFVNGGHDASDKYIAQNGDLVERLNRAMSRSVDYEHPDEVRRTIPTFPKIPPAVAEKIRLPVWSSKPDRGCSGGRPTTRSATGSSRRRRTSTRWSGGASARPPVLERGPRYGRVSRRRARGRRRRPAAGAPTRRRACPAPPR